MTTEEEKEMIDRFQAEINKIINNINEQRENFVKSWLEYMGWDGKAEHAREIVKGWVLKEEIRDNNVTFRMEREHKDFVDEIIEKASKFGDDIVCYSCKHYINKAYCDMFGDLDEPICYCQGFEVIEET